MNVAERVPAARLPVRRQLLAGEPGWQFSLMLAIEAVFLFVAIAALSAGGVDRSVVTLLQLLLAGIAIAALARCILLRLALATSFGLHPPVAAPSALADDGSGGCWQPDVASPVTAAGASAAGPADGSSTSAAPAC